MIRGGGRGGGSNPLGCKSPVHSQVVSHDISDSLSVGSRARAANVNLVVDVGDLVRHPVECRNASAPSPYHLSCPPSSSSRQQGGCSFDKPVGNVAPSRSTRVGPHDHSSVILHRHDGCLQAQVSAAIILFHPIPLADFSAPFPSPYKNPSNAHSKKHSWGDSQWRRRCRGCGKCSFLGRKITHPQRRILHLHPRTPHHV